MHYLLLSRSLTYAQRSARLLEQKGIKAILMKAPAGIRPSGCAYSVRIREKDKEEALRILDASDLSPQRIFLVDGDLLSEVPK